MNSRTVIQILIWTLIVLMLIALALFASPKRNNPYDSTDNVIEEKRSGMHILIDNGTGCEYLAVKSWDDSGPRQYYSGITPRLGLGGKQLGCHSSQVSR